MSCSETIRHGGRWGVAQACNYPQILDAIATLIAGRRADLAMVLIEREKSILKQDLSN